MSKTKTYKRYQEDKMDDKMDNYRKGGSKKRRPYNKMGGSKKRYDENNRNSKKRYKYHDNQNDYYYY